MIGYHYTTYTNWQSIKSSSLKAYPIRADVRRRAQKLSGFPFVPDISGAYVWRYRPDGDFHVANIIHVLSRTGEHHVVLLEVPYELWDVLTVGGAYFTFTSRMPIGRFCRGEAEYDIVTAEIPGELISCVGEWNLPDLFTYEN